MSSSVSSETAPVCATASSSDPASIAFKLGRAEGYKAEGNAHFKTGLFKKAVISYGKALAYVKCLPGSKRGNENSMTEMAMNASREAPSHSVVTAEQDLAAKDIEGVVHTNISVCYIKQGDGVMLRTPGGGGYGAPRDRPTERRAADELDGYVSAPD